MDMSAIPTNNQSFISEVAADLVKDTTKFAWNKVKKYFKDINAKDSIDLGIAYQEYLDNTRKKYEKVKTIIYRRIPKDIYSFYECINVEYNGLLINTCQSDNLLSLTNKLLVTGTGGSGKSMLFKYLFLDVSKNSELIPVLIELRSINSCDIKDINLFTIAYTTLVNNGFSLESEYFEYSMKEGAYIFFFDGYDEIKKDRTSVVARQIKELASKYHTNWYFVSSRPSEEFIGWNDFHEARTQKLTKEQAVNLIHKIEFEPSAKEKFCAALESHLYDDYHSFASNPLLLTIMLLTYEKHASIPEKLNGFYDEAFVTLFNVHDATKDSYVRDIRSGLGCEDFKSVFSYICFKSYFNAEFEFSEARLRYYIQAALNKMNYLSFSVDDFKEDLFMSVCMLVKDGFTYRFAHRSFQEYFAALYTCKLMDDTQSKLLLQWIKESGEVIHDSYFPMLHDLQSDKVNRLVIIPILKDIQKLYEQYGFSIELLDRLFYGVIIKKRESEKYPFFLSLGVKNSYLVSGLDLNISLNNYPFYEDEDKRSSNLLITKLWDSDSKKRSQKWTFTEVLKTVSSEELLDGLKWFESHIKFSIDIINKYEGESIGRKKKVSSILDEL